MSVTVIAKCFINTMQLANDLRDFMVVKLKLQAGITKKYFD